MIGLLLKDFIGLKKYLTFILLFIGAAFLLSMVLAGQHEADFLSGAMMGILSIVFPIFSITTFSLDDLCKWDRYGMTMPVSRKQVVLSKYLLGIVLEVLSLVLSVIVMGLLSVKGTLSMNVQETMLSIGLLGCVALCLIAVILPLTFRFGSEKTRLILLGFCLLPLMVNAVKSRIGELSISMETMVMWIKLFPAIALLLFVGSIFLSMWIYEKKEF